MSSMANRATGPGKPKPLNVNSIYSGRNLAAGSRPTGKYGLQSVGKTTGVVRRMPPPATLPSLKAENNGQDPTINVVPQGGTGWNKSDESTNESETVTNSVSVVPNTGTGTGSVGFGSSSNSGADLRPTWAKPVSEHSTAPVTGQHSSASTREFPSLAAASTQDKDGNGVINKWTTGELPHQVATRESHLSFDDPEGDRNLPSRFYDNAQQGQYARRKPNSTRFQSSNDARLSPPPNYQGNVMQNKRWSEDECNVDSRRVHRDSERSGTGTNVSDGSISRGVVHSGSGNGFFDGSNATESVKAVEPARETFYSSEMDKDREAAIERSRQRRAGYKSTDSDNEIAAAYNKPNYSQNGERPFKGERAQQQQGHTSGYQGKRQAVDSANIQQQQPQEPKFQILKRPQTLDLEDVSDEEEVQMTKLDKPSLRIIKRAADAKENTATEGAQAKEVDRDGNKSQIRQEKSQKPDGKTESSAESADTPKAKAVEEAQPAPPPAENIWAKRKEERESQERNMASKIPKAMQQAIEQHFPSVVEAASIKVAKEVARKASDLEFAKVALRARKQPTSNDVRQLASHDAEYYQDRVRVQRDRMDHMNYGRNDRLGGSGKRGADVNGAETSEKDRAQEYGFEEQGQDNYYSNGNKDLLENERKRHEEREIDYEIEQNRYTRGSEFDEDAQTPNAGQRDVGQKSNYNRPSTRGRAIRGGTSYGTKGGRGATRGGRHADNRQFHIQKRGDEEGEIEENEAKQTGKEKDEIQLPDDQKRSDQFDRETDNETEKTQDTGMSGERKEYGQRNNYPSRGGRYSNYQNTRGVRGKGRGGLSSGYNYKGKAGEQLQELRGPRRRQQIDDESEEAGQPISGGAERGRGGRHQQGQYEKRQRGAGKYQRGRGPRNEEGSRGNGNAEDETRNDTGIRKDVDRLKSPVASSEGHEEWETASESSGRGKREEANERSLQKSSSRSSVPPQGSNARTNAGSNQYQNKMQDSRIRSKNAQPASRTSHSPSANSSSSSRQMSSAQSNNNRRQNPSQMGPNDRDRNADRGHNKLPHYRKSDRDELAGLDLNCVDGSVVVVDSQMQELGGSDIDDFEEVVSKKVKRQQEKEKAARLEAEERRKQKEKERREKIAAAKAARANAKKDMKRPVPPSEKTVNASELFYEDTPTDAPVIMNEMAEMSALSEDTIADFGRMKDMITVKTVWTRSHVEEMEKDTDKEFNESPTVIPSPIARPTPRCKSATDAALHPEELKERLVELPVPLSNSQPLQHTDNKYDFTFDPHLHEVQHQREVVVEKVHHQPISSVPVSATVSETGSIDDQRLKEKLNKVKDLWPGEHEKENPIVSASSALPSNVAKVKPQPQSGDVKEEMGKGTGIGMDNDATGGSCNRQANFPRSPAPFSNIGGGLAVFQPYPPIALGGDMSSNIGAGYMGPFGSSAPVPSFPPNAASPPVNTYPGPPIGRQQQRPPIQQNFVEHNNPVYVPNRPSQTNLWTPNQPGPLDGMITQFGGSLTGQQPPNQNSMLFQAPIRQQQNRQFGNTVGNNSPTIGTGLNKGNGNGNFLFNNHPSNEVNLPPPNLAVGSQRVAAPPQSMHPLQAPPPVSFAPMGGPLSGSSFNQLGSGPMNVNQPPPSFNQPPPNIRFPQPPPQADPQWGAPIAPPNKQPQQSIMGFNFPGSLPPQPSGPSARFPTADVWSSSPSFNAPAPNNGFGGVNGGGPLQQGGPFFQQQQQQQQQRGANMFVPPKMQSVGNMKRPPSNANSTASER